MVEPRLVESKYFRGRQYGRLWWIIHLEDNTYEAIGSSGNVIYVNPRESIVAAVSPCFKPRVFDRVDFIEQVLLPSVLQSFGSLLCQTQRFLFVLFDQVS